MSLAVIKPHILRDLRRVQIAMMGNIEASIESMSGAFRASIHHMMAELNAAKWDRQRVRAIVRRWTSHNFGRAERAIVSQIADATKSADIWAERIRLLRPKDTVRLSPSDRYWLTTKAHRGAEAASALARHATAHAVRPYAGKLAISDALHSLSDAQGRKVSSMVLRSIREGQNLNFASRDLVSMAKGIGAKSKIPQGIRRVQTAASRMVSGLGSEDLDAELVHLKKYLRRLKATGRVQGGCMELIEKLAGAKDSKAPGDAVRKALGTWAHHKQRYVAERILETETNAAYRTEQTEKTSKLPWVVGYRWHTYRPGGGKWDCDCLAMAGKLIPADEIDQYRGGLHPFCRCWFEEIFDDKKMLTAPTTSNEKRWLAENFS